MLENVLEVVQWAVLMVILLLLKKNLDFMADVLRLFQMMHENVMDRDKLIDELMNELRKAKQDA